LAKALVEAKAAAEAQAAREAKAAASALQEAVAKAKAQAQVAAEVEAKADELAKAVAKAKAKAEAKAKNMTRLDAQFSETHADQSAQPSSSPPSSPAKHRVQGTEEIKAYGDPHMQNVLGQHFDLMQPGSHTLVQIPRFAEKKGTKFRVQAGVERIGRACADMYIQTLNVTGQWVYEHRQGGLHFSARAQRNQHSKGTNWMNFGGEKHRVGMKVVYGHTSTGTSYLNFFVRHLKDTGYPVGGLLGQDDHTDAAKPSSSCKKVLVLLQGAGATAEGRSVAEAS